MSKLSKWLKGAEKAISNAIPHQHSADRRAANQAVSEQISFYQQQKADMAEEKTRVEGERAAEKKKINQKQIKSMRRSYRAPGFLDEASDSMSESLG
jgi:hypothetical protein